MNATRTEATKDNYLTDPAILKVARQMRCGDRFALDPATNMNNPTDARIICVEPGVLAPAPFEAWCLNQADHVLEDGLAQDWVTLAAGGMIWVNPPFGRAKLAFLEKAGRAYWRGAEIQMLVPCDPGTGWWQDHVSPRIGTARAVCHLRRRPQFYDPATGLAVRGKDGKPQGPQFSCNIVYWGGAVEAFCDVWAPLGDVDRGHR